jgi:PleD family two-component response regulator
MFLENFKFNRYNPPTFFAGGALMDRSREQILVVEDEAELRTAIVEILTVEGFEVEQAVSAEEAI